MWFAEQDSETSELIGAAIDVLGESGPTLGRPLVDTITAALRHKNLKELRPGSTGRSKWYRKAIPLAERRFDEHIERLGGDEDD